jgi:hypothetical protein
VITAFTQRRITRQAGSSAASEYRRLTKEWRASKRRFFRSLTAVAVLVYLLTFIPSRHHPFVYLGGVLTGALAFGVALLRETPPPWIENWQIGAWGEQRTAAALMPLLRRGWVVVHDLGRLKSNVDHVLIGPAGVIVLDSKNLHGTVRVSGDRLALTRPGQDRTAYESDSCARQARSQAADVNALFRQRIGQRPWVTAVVVIWADFPEVSASANNVNFVHGDHLREWLEKQPARLNAQQIEELAGALGPRHSPHSRTALPADPPTSHGPVSPRVT